jgi:predicted transcriptional regulator of viral defense system
MRKSFLDAQEIFRNHGGILRTGQAKRLGIDTKTIAEMHEAGLLQRLGRGLYRLSELPPLQYPDLVQIALRVPKAVVCLISALAFHDLTTEIPHKVYIALPQTVRQPQINYPPLDVVWLSQAGYEAGIEEQRLDGVIVPIYEKTKTIADCFKFRNKVGKEVAIEALKEYVRLPDADIAELLHYAQINRVERIMRPYLEAVL